MDVTWHPLKIEFNININPGLLRNVLTFNPRFLKGRFMVVQTIENWWELIKMRTPKLPFLPSSSSTGLSLALISISPDPPGGKLQMHSSAHSNVVRSFCYTFKKRSQEFKQSFVCGCVPFIFLIVFLVLIII